jgi:hypothetical protein
LIVFGIGLGALINLESRSFLGRKSVFLRSDFTLVVLGRSPKAFLVVDVDDAENGRVFREDGYAEEILDD